MRRGVGAYLVRSKTAYLFQIRLPKELGGGRGVRPIRIGLGACPAREARRIAESLAAEARRCFSEIRTRRLSEGEEEKEPSNETAVEPLLSGADSIEAVAEARGYLKAVQQFVQVTAPAPTPEQERQHEGWRGLVRIARELAT